MSGRFFECPFCKSHHWEINVHSSPEASISKVEYSCQGCGHFAYRDSSRTIMEGDQIKFEILPEMEMGTIGLTTIMLDYTNGVTYIYKPFGTGASTKLEKVIKLNWCDSNSVMSTIKKYLLFT